MSKEPMLRNVNQATLGPAHEKFQCALASIQAEPKTICKPEKINTYCIPSMLQILGFLLNARNNANLGFWGRTRKTQVHNSGIITMNAGCIARSPINKLQGHPALRPTIEKKPATIVKQLIKRLIQESRQDTTVHSWTAGNLNHLMGEVHQLQEQLERGNL